MLCSLVYAPFGSNVLLPTPPIIPLNCICPTAANAHGEIMPLSLVCTLIVKAAAQGLPLLLDQPVFPPMIPFVLRLAKQN